MTDQPPNPIVDLMLQFRKALQKHDRQAVGRLVDAYERIYARLRDKIDLLVDAIELDNPTAAQLARMGRYKSLITQIEEELTKFQAVLSNEIEEVGRDAIAFANRDTARLLRAIGQDEGQDVSVNRLPADVILLLLGFLAADSQLFKRIDNLASVTTQGVADAILEAVGLGKSPQAIAGLIRDNLGGGLTDAMRMTKTAQMWAYREAKRAIYAENADQIEGWYWIADLTNNPCMACIAEHGTFHGLDEVLDDHHNGHCDSIPAVRGFRPPRQVEVSGEEWFNGLSDAEQQKLMGPEFWNAWKGGAFELGDMAHRVENDVYGNMINERPLWDLLGAEPPTNTGEFVPFEPPPAPASFMTREGLDKFYADYHLPPDDNIIVEAYGNTTYRIINPELRGQPVDLKYAEIAKVIEERGDLQKLTTILDEAPKLPDDLRVYRGFGVNNISELPGVGASIIDKGFVSTSIEREIAEKFMSSIEKEKGYKGFMAEIMIPKGTRGIWMDAIYGVIGENYDFGEKEFLLGRDHQFTINSVDFESRLIRMVLSR